ncbi:hypothetical protein QUF63_02010 [Anaerolineales bacterium HSG25]|nr:hypothetical protein [Anaerolineales bacterium HSG25]
MGLILVSMLNRLGCDGQYINYNTVPNEQVQIWDDFIVGQSFVAQQNNLNQIDLLFLTYWRTNTEDVTVTLTEMSDPNRYPEDVPPIHRTSFNPATLQNESWRSFTFPHISDSQGKTYLITVQSPNSVDGNAVTLGGIDADVYPMGIVFLTNIPVPSQELTFRVCYALTTVQKLERLAHRLTDNRPSAWGEISFYIILFSLYVLLVVLFFWQLVKTLLR